jgi:hypothetical protein
MDIYAKRGHQVRFIGASDDQVKYRGNDDPRTVLKVGDIYTIHHTSVGDWHTDVYLVGFPGKRFNSVHFKDAPRASVMPPHVDDADPTFADAAFRNFEPETPEQRAAFREKSEAIWRAANGVRR